jgi:hypothetical protein
MKLTQKKRDEVVSCLQDVVYASRLHSDVIAGGPVSKADRFDILEGIYISIDKLEKAASILGRK